MARDDASEDHDKDQDPDPRGERGGSTGPTKAVKDGEKGDRRRDEPVHSGPTRSGTARQGDQRSGSDSGAR